MVGNIHTMCLENEIMRVMFDPMNGGIVSLTSAFDEHRADFVLTPEEFPEYCTEDCKWLGNLEGRFAIEGQQRLFSTGKNRKQEGYSFTDAATCNGVIVHYGNLQAEGENTGIDLEERFELKGDILSWRLCFKNVGDMAVTLEELSIPFLMNQRFRKDDEFKYDYCMMRHTCIAGAGSYLYWEKSSGNAPVLLFAPVKGTILTGLSVEKDDPVFRACFGEDYGYEGLVHAAVVDKEAAVKLEKGGHAEFEFAFVLMKEEQQINDCLYAIGCMNLQAVPGMVGPAEEVFTVMTRPADAVLSTEYAEDLILKETVKDGWKISSVKFGGYGKRRLYLSDKNGIGEYCFFITEPVQDMIDHHAAFIAKNHQETDEEDPCYHGLLMWDMVHKRRINSSFNPYFEDWWRGGSDDPGLASGLFLAEKNVYRADKEEIKVLNAYVEDFIIKRLTEQPGWRVHRMVPWYTMFEPWAGRGADDVWRAYNYVHVINVMYDMYLIQKQHSYSELRTEKEYLLMAYEYTKAMFNYWMFPHGVGASEFGNMGEMTLPLFLSQTLKEEGYEEESAEMGAIFDKKAHYFNSRQYPFGSEMVYDSTAFEAVYGYGKRIKSDHIMGMAARASFANRGKQPVWFLYNTDVRGGGDSNWNSSYMTQLGAWPIMDYALNQGHIEEARILSGYGALLSGWLIYNSGGYWSEEAENSGATGWITVASLINHSGQPPMSEEEKKTRKLRMPFSNGCVVLSGEAGIVFFGALRTACSIVMDHSILGRIALGADYRVECEKELITPRDGLNVRFYHVPERWKAEVFGGKIDKIVSGKDEVSIRMTSLCRNGIQLVISTIPEEGREQQVLRKCNFMGGENTNVELVLDKKGLIN